MNYQVNALMDFISKDKVFLENYHNYKADKEMLSDFVKKHPEGHMTIVALHECGDSRRDVPKMGRIFEHMKNWTVEVIPRDRVGIPEKYRIMKTPTFIFETTEGVEIGKIIEQEKFSSLEEDMSKIAMNEYISQ